MSKKNKQNKFTSVDPKLKVQYNWEDAGPPTLESLNTSPEKLRNPNKMDASEMSQIELAILVSMGEMAKKMTTHGVMYIHLTEGGNSPAGVPDIGGVALMAEFVSLPELMERGVNKKELVPIALEDPRKRIHFILEGQMISRNREDLIEEAADYQTALRERHGEYKAKQAEVELN